MIKYSNNILVCGQMTHSQVLYTSSACCNDLSTKLSCDLGIPHDWLKADKHFLHPD